VNYTDQKIRVWNTQTGRLSKTIQANESQPAINFAADGKTIITRNSGETAEKLIEKLKAVLPKNNTVYHVFSNDY